MKALLSAMLFFVLPCANPAQTQPVPEMTPERIKEAVEYGKERGPFEYGQWGNTNLMFLTPFLRVASAASLAIRDKRPFTEQDVSKEMTRPILEVLRIGYCSRFFPVEYWGVAIAAGKGPDAKIIKPLSQEIVTTDCGRDGKPVRSVKATFPLAVLAEGNVFRFESDVGADIVMEAKVLDKVPVR